MRKRDIVSERMKYKPSIATTKNIDVCFCEL